MDWRTRIGRAIGGHLWFTAIATLGIFVAAFFKDWLADLFNEWARGRLVETLPGIAGVIMRALDFAHDYPLAMIPLALAMVVIVAMLLDVVEGRAEAAPPPAELSEYALEILDAIEPNGRCSIHRYNAEAIVVAGDRKFLDRSAPEKRVKYLEALEEELVPAGILRVEGVSKFDRVPKSFFTLTTKGWQVKVSRET